MKHTPGPWTVHKSNNGHGYNIWANNDDHTLALAVLDITNARLIAAAPDLLVACKHAASSEHHPHCSSRRRNMTCSCHVEKARAAVAKATEEN